MLRFFYIISLLLFASQYSVVYGNTSDSDIINDSLIREEIVGLILDGNDLVIFKDYDNAIATYLQADSIAKFINDYKFQASCIYNIGLCYYRMGKYIECKDRFSEAIYLCEIAGDTINMSLYQLGLGVLYRKQGDYAKASDYMFKALLSFKKSKNYNLAARAYNSLAGVSSNLKNDSIAFEYYKLALETFEKINDSSGMAEVLNNTGLLYNRNSDVQNAKYFLIKSLAIKMNLNDAASISITLNNLGESFYKNQEYLLAEKYYLQALDYAHSSGILLRTVPISNSLAELYIKKKNYLEAEKQLSDSRTFAVNNSANELLQENYRLSSLLYTKTNRFKQAIEYSNLYIELSNKIFDIEKMHTSNELRFQYETEKKDLEIYNLIEIDKIKTTTLQTKNTSLIIISGALFISFLLAIALYFAYKQKQKAYIKIQLLIKEKYHRTKNNLQLLSSVLSLQSMQADQQSKNTALTVEHRVQSVLLLDKLLYNNENNDRVNIDAYLKKIINGLQGAYDNEKKVSFDMQIDSISLAAYQATHLGLIINELITNSLKYAFDNIENPIIKIRCVIVREGECQLIIMDNGPGLPDKLEPKSTSSIGLKLIKTMSKQLQGEYSFSNNDGFLFDLLFKMK